MIGTMAVAGFVRAWWKPIGAVLCVAAVLALVYLIGRAHADRAWEKRYGAAEADWNAAVARAAEKTRAAEAEKLRVETAWRDHVAKREREYRDDKTRTDAALAAERLSNGRLRDAVDHFVRAGGAAADPGAACGDLRSRVATLGVLVGEADQLAGESARAADRARDGLALCRGYVDALRRAQ